MIAPPRCHRVARGDNVTGEDMLRFDGRVAVITGAGQGLGREYALRLAERGARLVVNDYAADGTARLADQVAADIVAAGGEAVASYDSVATRTGGAALVEKAMDRFGRVDIVINNAGIVRDHAFQNLQADDILDVLEVHLMGGFWVTQPAYKIMRNASYGRIVFTTSLSGLLGNFGQANYGAAKTGVIGLARVLATEGAKYGIRANVIAPLAQTAMARHLTAFDVSAFSVDKVAAVVTYLAHEDCAVSGEILSAIGGRVARYFIGLTRGVYREQLAPEDVSALIGSICDTEGFSEPRGMSDEIDSVVALTVSPDKARSTARPATPAR